MNSNVPPEMTTSKTFSANGRSSRSRFIWMNSSAAPAARPALQHPVRDVDPGYVHPSGLDERLGGHAGADAEVEHPQHRLRPELHARPDRVENPLRRAVGIVPHRAVICLGPSVEENLLWRFFFAHIYMISQNRAVAKWHDFNYVGHTLFCRHLGEGRNPRETWAQADGWIWPPE